MDMAFKEDVMTKHIKFFLTVVLAACLLTACAFGDRRPPATLYDLGPLKTESLSRLPENMPVISTKVHSPEWMNENLMFYRLDYVNDQQVRFYTESSWNSPPSRLFKNRLDSYLVAAGNTVTGIRTSLPTLTLRIYLEDFTQHFSSPSDNASRIVLRASLFKGRDLVAQKSFRKDVASATADAPGGARALAQASDELIAEVMNWMAQTKE